MSFIWKLYADSNMGGGYMFRTCFLTSLFFYVSRRLCRVSAATPPHPHPPPTWQMYVRDRHALVNNSLLSLPLTQQVTGTLRDNITKQ